ncbi:hypothetical protein C5167_015308 [Papaver somniferum]|uniref:Uncharacterized protein n=1 Tax=Papaver somniferum TaxID=3469 RepID=A0A4Y7JA10_PAPSO|nr:hypothetical protein C5167_015308 [Papaver somniferum]
MGRKTPDEDNPLDEEGTRTSNVP